MNSELNEPHASPEPAETVTLSSDEKNWLLALHFSALAGLVIPLASIIAPLVVWLIKKDELPVVNEHGKAVLNFQITCGIASIVCAVLMLVLIGFLLLPILLLFWLVMTIVGGVKAADGKLQNFYFTLPIIR